MSRARTERSTQITTKRTAVNRTRSAGSLLSEKLSIKNWGVRCFRQRPSICVMGSKTAIIWLYFEIKVRFFTVKKFGFSPLKTGYGPFLSKICHLWYKRMGPQMRAKMTQVRKISWCLDTVSTRHPENTEED